MAPGPALQEESSGLPTNGVISTQDEGPSWTAEGLSRTALGLSRTAEGPKEVCVLPGPLSGCVGGGRLWGRFSTQTLP